MREIFSVITGWACGLVAFSLSSVAISGQAPAFRDQLIIATLAGVGLALTVFVLFLPIMIAKRRFPRPFRSRTILVCGGAGLFLIPTLVVAFLTEGFKFGIFNALSSPEAFPWYVMFAVAGAVSAMAVFEPKMNITS